MRKPSQKTHLDAAKRSANCGGPSPNACIYVIASAGYRKLGVSRAKTLQGAEYHDEDCQKESGSSQGWARLVLQGTVVRSRPHTHRLKRWTQQVVVIYLCIHIIYNICTYRHMYATIIKGGVGRYWLKSRRNMGEIGRKRKRNSM